MYTPVPTIRRANFALVAAALVSGFVTATQAQCVGDCSGDNEVTVNEIVVGVNIALGTGTLAACPAFDADGSGDVTVNEIVAAVNNALLGCAAIAPTATPRPTLTPTTVPSAPASPSPTPPAATPTNAPLATPTATVGTPGATATATATASATATAGAATCGNGVLEDGESCDDGNMITNPPSDTCPSDCTIINCATAGTTRTVSVSFTPPAGKSVSSISVLLEYPDGTVKVPGTGSDTSVQSAVSNTPSGALVAAVDYDYALVVQLAGTRAMTPGKLFDLTVRDCRGVAVPTADQFKCRVTDASAPDASSVSGVTCAATLP